jgi:hypothetical protein
VIAQFRDILTPLIADAIPAKDIKTLESAAPTLDGAMASLARMDYKTHYNAKYQRYKERRDELRKEVDQYVQAAGLNDTSAVLKLLPQVQEHFEATCAELVPYSWPQFEQLWAATRALLDSVKVKSDAIILKAAVDSVTAKVAAMAQGPVPDSCQFRAKLIEPEVAYFTKLAGKMAESQGHGDLVKLRDLANELDTRLGTFELYYLQ